MSDVHEHLEHAEHVEHAAHSNKKVALVIALLALFLAFSETLGKGAQTAALSENIQASDLWNFFQAKTIRQTVLRTAGETNAIAVLADPAAKAAMEKQIDTWKKTIDRYESEPSTNEGRKELTKRALELEHQRDTNLAKYENYELASAAFQIGIVLASASVITGLLALVYGAAGLGAIGLMFMGFGLFSPETLEHLQHMLEHAGPVAGH
jgi:ABC-type nickel/cobalt efflux system permease component RcnA